MFTAIFWKKTAERSIKTMGQFLVGLWAGQQVNVFEIGWQVTFGMVAGAGLLSVLTSIGSSAIGDEEDPSLVADEKPIVPQPVDFAEVVEEEPQPSPHTDEEITHDPTEDVDPEEADDGSVR